MTTRYLPTLSLILLPALACQNSAPPATTTTVPTVEAAQPAEVARFGAEVAAGPAITVSKIFAEADTLADAPVIAEGTVKAVCQAKGCWMELADSNADDAAACRITFKDYAFFVPKDAKGKLARIQGTVATKTLSKEDVDHLEAEGATFANKLPDGTAKQLTLVASGVELRDAI